MASYGHQMPPHGAAAHPHAHHGAQRAPVAAAPGVPAPPAGTFSSGTKIQVGSHRVVIQKYLSEGGFAHVYLVKLSKPIDDNDVAVLKRVAVPDKEALRGMRIEVETMKRLKGHRPIVTYIDSHASELKGGGYEVFLLMEYCNGGGLIDFMNTRLQHRLTEPEILHIFADIAEGVACMHYLKPPLLHRDLKVENVLITSRGSSKRFKLCDFGSASAPRPAPTSVVECRLMDEDVQKHTTMQYRSPEMIDVYRKQPLNEKSDIWALGVLLYKLCYYTTPFEDQGQLAILNASYKYPSHPVFSDRLKILIASMLKEDLQARPNIYQVLKEACSMQGRQVPIKDIYGGRSHSEPSRTERPTRPHDRNASSKPTVGAVWSPEKEEKPIIPDIVPMRRGRPAASPAPSQSSHVPRPAAKSGGDPFAALDSRTNRQSELVDDLSSRFPSLDQFSLLHDQGAKFEFESSQRDASQGQSRAEPQVADRLADEAFASYRESPPVSNPGSKPATPSLAGPRSPPALGETLSKVPSNSSKSDISRAQSIISGNPDLRAISSQNTSKYVSIGTMTADFPEASPRPGGSRPDSRTSARAQAIEQRQPVDTRPASNPRVSSLQASGIRERSSAALRSSIDGESPEVELPESASRSRSAMSKSRPVSASFESSTLDYLREKESTAKSSPRNSPRIIPAADAGGVSGYLEAGNRGSLIDLDDNSRQPESWAQEKKGKRASSASLSGSVGGLAGKFGEAFKRFEKNAPSPSNDTARPPSPSKQGMQRDLTPIAGSEATDGRSDDGIAHDAEEEMSPEKRREYERQQLLEEEQRVEKAQAEYRQRVAEGSGTVGPTPLPRSIGGVPRALSIQNRVQSLLSEEQTAPVQRTAHGYGKYSDAASTSNKAERAPPQIPRKPLVVSKTRPENPLPDKKPAVGIARSETTPSPAPPTVPPKPAGKPPAPKKPVHLNSFSTGGRPASPAKRGQQLPTEPLVAADLPGQPALDMTPQEKDDYLHDFSKRFPSLNAIEMDRQTQGSGQ